MAKVILPRLNQTGANEWADVQANDEAIATVVNGEISNENIAAGAAIARSKLEPGAQGIPGTTYPAVVIATEQTRESVTQGTLSTPDEVTGVVLPTNGIIKVSYAALWKSSVAEAGRAAIYLNAGVVGTLLFAGKVAEEATTGTTFHTLQSGHTAGAAPLRTGLELTSMPSAFAWIEVVEIQAAAGTYAVAVKFSATSGSVTVKERSLRVSVTTF